jgi:hypothetical protein
MSRAVQVALALRVGLPQFCLPAVYWPKILALTGNASYCILPAERSLLMWKYGCLLAPVVLVGAWYFWPKAPGTTETSRAHQPPAPKIVNAGETPPPVLLPSDLSSLPLQPVAAEVKSPAPELPPPLILTGASASSELPVAPSLPTGTQTDPATLPSLPLPPLPPLPESK